MPLEDSAGEHMLRDLGLREECVEGVSFLVSSVPMAHDAVAYHGRLLIGFTGQLMVEGAAAGCEGRFMIVLDEGVTFADGHLVSPRRSIQVGEPFFFDRGSSSTWTSEQVLSLVRGTEAMGVIGIGL